MLQRTITGILLVILALTMIAIDGVPMAVAILICAGISLYEEYKAIIGAGHHPVMWPTVVLLVANVPVAYFLGSRTVFPMVMFTSLMTVTFVIFQRGPKLEDVLMSLLPQYSIVLPAQCMVALAVVKPIEYSRQLLLLTFALPILSDTLAFLVGSRLKGPKLCPAVSPNKTVSGAIAGLAGSAIAAGIVYSWFLWLPLLQSEIVLPWYFYVLVVVIGGIASQMGDLFASMVKRSCGIKDFSNLFPGHGGMLDRIDSILFMGAAVYAFYLLLL